MNSIHDMGGMHGLARSYEPDEPVFHARWKPVWPR
jgi:hypothetical protein